MVVEASAVHIKPAHVPAPLSSGMDTGARAGKITVSASPQRGGGGGGRARSRSKRGRGGGGASPSPDTAPARGGAVRGGARGGRGRGTIIVGAGRGGAGGSVRGGRGSITITPRGRGGRFVSGARGASPAAPPRRAPKHEVKVVVRGLPPCLSEVDFDAAAGASVGKAVYKSFAPGLAADATYAGSAAYHSVAYLAFEKAGDADALASALHGSRFIDELSGTVCVAGVERALNQAIPRPVRKAAVTVEGTMESDGDFQAFLLNLESDAAAEKAAKAPATLSATDALFGDVVNPVTLPSARPARSLEPIVLTPLMAEIRAKRAKRVRTPVSVVVGPKGGGSRRKRGGVTVSSSSSSPAVSAATAAAVASAAAITTKRHERRLVAAEGRKKKGGGGAAVSTSAAGSSSGSAGAPTSATGSAVAEGKRGASARRGGKSRRGSRGGSAPTVSSPGMNGIQNGLASDGRHIAQQLSPSVRILKKPGRAGDGGGTGG